MFLLMDVAEEFIIICWAIFLIYFLASAFFTKRAIERRGWRVRVLFAAILACGFVLIRYAIVSEAAFSVGVGGLMWPRSFILNLIADTVTLIGLMVVLWARTVLGGNWSVNPEFKEKHELITRGPYHYVRHPIYSGILLMLLGFIIAYGRVLALLIFAIFFVGILVRSRQEEKLLAKHFPKEYPEYKARVKALIPFVL